jgi:hypothetical protein
MDEQLLRKTLQGLAHVVVRNELVTEYFLTQRLPVPIDDIGEKVREIDQHLVKNTGWQNRFPGLFPES